MNPPDCAYAWPAATTRPATAIETIQRGVPRDTTSLQPARQTGIDTALAAKNQMSRGRENRLWAISERKSPPYSTATEVPRRPGFRPMAERAKNRRKFGENAEPFRAAACSANGHRLTNMARSLQKRDQPSQYRRDRNSSAACDASSIPNSTARRELGRNRRTRMRQMEWPRQAEQNTPLTGVCPRVIFIADMLEK